MAETKVSVGLDLACVRELPPLLDAAVQQAFDFIAVPLFHPHYRRDAAGISDARTSPQTRSDLVLPGERWSSCVVGKLSPWLRLDSTHTHVRAASERAFRQEVQWAAHTCVPALMTTAPLTWDCANLAMHVNQTVQSGSAVHFWVSVPLTRRGEGEGEGAGGGDDPMDVAATPGADGEARLPLAGRPRDDPWQAWSTLRSLVEYHPQVSAVLEITADLPSPAALARWAAEPVKAAVLPTSIFVTNKHGFPTLTKAHQELLLALHARKVQFLLRGRPMQRDQAAAPGLLPSYKLYLQYIAHVLSRAPSGTMKDSFESPYYDYLQAPLQPLMDNLESQTYEVFERDPVKYSQYEAAVEAALRATPPEKITVVMVVGAGRGPLVHRVLAAAATAVRKVRVFAVEKNPNAVITLRNLVRTSWGDQVTVVSSDMRVWEAPELADILVSELLGSFGDNELSPECLDGAQRFLKSDGISIPSAYTSFLAPVMSAKLWNEVKAYKELKWFETAYVVSMFAHTRVAEPQACFTFEHPNRAARIDNRRYITLKFRAVSAGILHGFGGYFDATLFGDVHISINPASHSPGMFSWFPLFFPLREPMYVSEGDCIEIRMWRCVGPTKVWYEWAVTSPSVSPIHNPAGRSYYIGL